MIRISVEDYCQDCPDFEAEVKKNTLVSCAIPISTDTCITCKYSDRCRQIHKYMISNESKKGDKIL